jgi:hypothetical protein
MKPKKPTRYRAHTHELDCIINKAKVLKKQFPQDDALTFTIKQYMHIKKQLTTRAINQYKGCIIFINKKRGFFRLDDLELKIFFADTFRNTIYNAPKDAIFRATVEETKRDGKVVTRQLHFLQDTGEVRKEINPEAIKAHFENHAVFALRDVENFYRDRHDFSPFNDDLAFNGLCYCWQCGRGKPPIKRARWVFAKGLRPRNFFNKTKAKIKAAFEARMLAIENQPDYNQVIGELLDQDLQKGGTLVRGRKAFLKLFEDD